MNIMILIRRRRRRSNNTNRDELEDQFVAGVGF